MAKTMTVSRGSAVRSRFAESGAKIKSYANKKYTQVKNYGSGYKNDIVRAYEFGYTRGYDDAHAIPKRIGARSAATIGFGKGVKARIKTDKYKKHYKGSK